MITSVQFGQTSVFNLFIIYSGMSLFIFGTSLAAMISLSMIPLRVPYQLLLKLVPKKNRGMNNNLSSRWVPCEIYENFFARKIRFRICFKNTIFNKIFNLPDHDHGKNHHESASMRPVFRGLGFRHTIQEPCSSSPQFPAVPHSSCH